MLGTWRLWGFSEGQGEPRGGLGSCEGQIRLGGAGVRHPFLDGSPARLPGLMAQEGAVILDRTCRRTGSPQSRPGLP